MNYIECSLSDIGKIKEFTVYCYVEEVGEGFIIVRDHSSMKKLEGNFDVNKGKYVRIFGKVEGGRIIIDKILEVEGVSEYINKKILDFMKKLFIREKGFR